MNALEIDGRIRALGAALAQMMAQAGTLLLELQRTRGYVELGFSSICDYAYARLQFSPGKTRDAIKLSERAEGLPRIRAALEGGTAEWTKLRTVAAVATVEDEGLWLEKCATMTNRELEHAVAHVSGELPKIKTTFAWTDEEYGIIEAVVRDVRREVADCSRERALVIALQRVMAGDGNRPPIQVVVYRCEGCGTMEHETRLGAAPVEPATAARAACDAEVVYSRAPGRVASEVPPATRRMVLARDRHRCAVPGCSGRDYVEVHHILERENGGGHEPENLVTLCTRHHAAVHEGKLELLDVLDDVGWPNLGGAGGSRALRPRPGRSPRRSTDPTGPVGSARRPRRP
jgi:hypothetical protein